jgi:hypothetical protein
MICAGAGFLLAVLWMDLMFDVQVLATPDGSSPVPEAVLASIAGYYRRVTTDAAPMGRLIGIVMAATLLMTGVQALRSRAPIWLRVLPPLLILVPLVLVTTRVFPNAVLLGARSVSNEEQSLIARAVLADHLFCLACIVLLLLLQSAGWLRARSRAAG